MPEHESRSSRAVFDYELDVEHDGGRQIADWGGDELFNHVPRRRFRPGGGRRARGTELDALRAEAQESRRMELHEAQRELHDARHGARTRSGYAPSQQAAAESEPAQVAMPEMLADAEEPAAAPGRRTVTITGRPGPLAVPPKRTLGSDRRRPPRTAAERIGARPDRIAAWAFGLGLTLILIAVSTADAAPV